MIILSQFQKTRTLKRQSVSLNSVFEKNEMVLKDPSPLATISGTTDTGMTVQTRGWVKKDNFLTCKENLIKETAQAYHEAGITQPSIHVVS